VRHVQLQKGWGPTLPQGLLNPCQTLDTGIIGLVFQKRGTWPSLARTVLGQFSKSFRKKMHWASVPSPKAPQPFPTLTAAPLSSYISPTLALSSDPIMNWARRSMPACLVLRCYLMAHSTPLSCRWGSSQGSLCAWTSLGLECSGGR
jgi:hypothetical protein